MALRNPWLDVSLADYEGHMGSAHVAQTDLLADVLSALLAQHVPRSLAVLGCAGGNGFERVSPEVTARVVGVDINPSFIAAAGSRFAGRFGTLDLVVCDLDSEDLSVDPVDFVYAALLFEYLDVAATWRTIRRLLRHGGVAGTVVQLPGGFEAVTPSPFLTVQRLAPAMRLVSPEPLRDGARAQGGRELTSYPVESRAGKPFAVHVFQFDAMP